MSPLALLSNAPPPPPPPAEADEEAADRTFRPTGMAIACWVIASFAHACAVSSLSAGQTLAYRTGFFIGSFIGIGLVVALFAVITRRALRRSNKTANIVFSVGVFAWATLGVVNHHRTQWQAYAVERPPAQASARGSPVPPASSSARGFSTPAADTPHGQALQARAWFLLAHDFPREKPTAAMLVAMTDQGKPWQWMDTLFDPQTTSSEFKHAYQSWRQAEIRAGNNPKVNAAELSAITRLHDIRMAIARFRARHNNHPPKLTSIAALPANPLTGRKSVAGSGVATPADGWSYDEPTGTIRIVLPPANYAGLQPGEIEWLAENQTRSTAP